MPEPGLLPAWFVLLCWRMCFLICRQRLPGSLVSRRTPGDHPSCSRRRGRPCIIPFGKGCPPCEGASCRPRGGHSIVPFGKGSEAGSASSSPRGSLSIVPLFSKVTHLSHVPVREELHLSRRQRHSKPLTLNLPFFQRRNGPYTHRPVQDKNGKPFFPKVHCQVSKDLCPKIICCTCPFLKGIPRRTYHAELGLPSSSRAPAPARPGFYR